MALSREGPIMVRSGMGIPERHRKFGVPLGHSCPGGVEAQGVLWEVTEMPFRVSHRIRCHQVVSSPKVGPARLT